MPDSKNLVGVGLLLIGGAALYLLGKRPSDEVPPEEIPEEIPKVPGVSIGTLTISSTEDV